MRLWFLCDGKRRANLMPVSQRRYGAACGSLMRNVKRGLRRLAISAKTEMSRAGRSNRVSAGNANEAGASDATLLNRTNMPNTNKSNVCFIAS